MNKEALIIGGGSKFGLQLVQEFLSQNWKVNVISGTKIEDHFNLKQLNVDWKKISVADVRDFLKTLSCQNFIFFNQNSSALSQSSFNLEIGSLDLLKLEKDWLQAYFVSCILPYHIIHSLKNKISPGTKIGWMVSSLVTKQLSNQIGFADYIGNKFQNYLLMKNFSKNIDAVFFAINPDLLKAHSSSVNIQALIKFIENSTTSELNGKVLQFNTNEDLTFKEFDDE